MVNRHLAQRSGVSPFSRLIAIGKAAPAMAAAADEWQRAAGRGRESGVVVCPADAAADSARFPVIRGDHPVPGPGSAAAAAALLTASHGLTKEDRVLLLLSGGTSSLAAAPIPGLSGSSLRQVFRLLLASGLDIQDSNRIRKRFLLWGGGRLAAALAPARTVALAISDVANDDPATIGSGPVSPDPATAADVVRLLALHDLSLPDDAREALQQVVSGQAPETPKPGAPCFEGVQYEVIAGNRDALEAAAGAASRLGFDTTVHPEGLVGEAAVAGAAIAQQLLSEASTGRRALVLGGETTVSLGTATGVGGRSLELALAAARALAGNQSVLILAAGTDGIDGTSRLAGGLVDGETWRRIPRAAELLAAHDSARALTLADATLATGLTGTNVRDLVIALRW